MTWQPESENRDTNFISVHAQYRRSTMFNSLTVKPRSDFQPIVRWKKTHQTTLQYLQLYKTAAAEQNSFFLMPSPPPVHCGSIPVLWPPLQIVFEIFYSGWPFLAKFRRTFVLTVFTQALLMWLKHQGMVSSVGTIFSIGEFYIFRKFEVRMSDRKWSAPASDDFRSVSVLLPPRKITLKFARASFDPF